MKTRGCFVLILFALFCFAPTARAEMDAASFERTAVIHESGHATLALLYGDVFRLKSVDIEDHGPDNGGRTLITAHIKFGDDRAKIIRYLAQWLAGKAAEEMLLGSALPFGSDDDEAQAAGYARQLLGPNADYRTALTEAKSLAWKEIDKHRKQVVRLANALLKRRYLTGLEVTRIWYR